MCRPKVPRSSLRTGYNAASSKLESPRSRMIDVLGMETAPPE